MLWICTACTCAYAVGAPACPQCGSGEHVEAGSAEHRAWLDAHAKPAKKAAAGREASDVGR